jgi:hypothetical protein
VEGLNVGNRTIKKPTLRFRIEPYKNLPLLSRRFDVITAHQICFNGHKTENLWGVDEWHFPQTTSKKIASIPEALSRSNLTFNKEPSIGFYTMELRKYFESRSARIFRGRVIISRGNPRSQSSPTAGPHCCNGRRSLGMADRLTRFGPGL